MGKWKRCVYLARNSQLLHVKWCKVVKPCFHGLCLVAKKDTCSAGFWLCSLVRFVWTHWPLCKNWIDLWLWEDSQTVIVSKYIITDPLIHVRATLICHNICWCAQTNGFTASWTNGRLTESWTMYLLLIILFIITYLWDYTIRTLWFYT